jgi:hypothetical protein
MNVPISFIMRRVRTPAGEEVDHLEARDWRLLAFLVWKAHQCRAGDAGTPAFERDTLVGALALGSPQELRNALAGALRILRAVDSERYLIVENGTISVNMDVALESDLNLLFNAARENQRDVLASLIQDLPFAPSSLEYLVKGLQPRPLRLREKTRWVETMVEEIRVAAGVAEPAHELSNEKTSDEAPELIIDDITEAYLRSHIERCSSIDPSGMDPSRVTPNIRLPLEDVYISLVVGPNTPFELAADNEVTSSEAQREDVLMVGPDAREGLLLFDEEEDIHFTDLIRDDRWSVILGKPGMGKTTLLHWITLHHARALLESKGDPGGEHRVRVEGAKLGVDEKFVDLGPARLPILVQVGDWASSAESDDISELIDFLGHHLVADEPLPGEKQAVSELIRRWLAAGRALVLLDGLDEVSDARLRKEIVKRVERFVRGYVVDPVSSGAFEPWNEDGTTPWWKVQASRPVDHGGNQIVVTSREHGYKEASLVGFRLVQARPLSMQAVERFCKRWTLAVERYRVLHSDQPDSDELQEVELVRRAEANAERLIKAIDSHANIRRLVDNPLLLTVLAMLQRESDRLPTTRLELYVEASRVLVERRTDWLLEEVIDILGPFALWLQEHQPSGHASLKDVRAHLRQGIERSVMPHEVDEQIDAFVREAQQQVALLVEVGSDRYGFMHGTFREYFAAMELARDPEAFRGWFIEHMHSPRWVEVSLLGVAAIAQNHPGQIEGILEEALGQQHDPEALLHHDLLFVATCLAESARSSPLLVTSIVDRLLAVGANAREARFDGLRRRIVQVLSDLRQMRSRVSVPALVKALEDPAVSPIATEVLADAPAQTPGLLEGLDRACQSPDRSPLAVVARARVATQLLEEGEDVPDHLQPLGTLFEQYPAATAIMTESKSPLAAQLRRLEDRVQPMLYGVLRWLLAAVEENPAAATTDDSLAEKMWTRLFETLPKARGADLSALAAFAFRLDPERTRADLARMLELGATDAPSLARYLASHSEALLPVGALGEWLDRLDAEAIAALFRLHHPVLRTHLRGPAWVWLALDKPAVARGEAQLFLYRDAAGFGWLPASEPALNVIRDLILAEDRKTQRIGETLLACLRIPQQEPILAEEIFSLLESIIAAEDDPRGTAAAVMLAEIPSRPLSLAQYELLAKALAEEDALRPRVFEALSLARPAACVGDDLLERADAYEKAARESDPAVAHLHSNLGMTLYHEDAERVLDAIEHERPWAGQCKLLPAAADAVIEALPEMEPAHAVYALEACRVSLRDRHPIGFEVGKLLAISLTAEDAEVRCSAAIAAAAETTLSGDLDSLIELLRGLAEVDRDAAAAGLREAAHCLPSARVSDREEAARTLQAQWRSIFSDGESVSWRSAGAMLAVDVLLADSAPMALVSLGERTTTHDEMARAILFALSTDHGLPRTGLDGQPGAIAPESLVTHRLCEAAAVFGTGGREISAMLKRVRTGIDDDAWQVRRASLMVLSAIATATPGQFLKWAQKTDLRERVLEAGQDPESFTARSCAIGVLSRFRVLDQRTLDLVGAACGDYSAVSSGLLERCRTFEESTLDISRVLRLLQLSNPRLVGAATVLVANLACTAPATYGGLDQRRAAVRALATAAVSPDPMLDCFVVGPGRTLRQVLQEQLVELVWEGSKQRRSDTALGTAATAESWGFPEPTKPPRAEESSRASTVLAQTVRTVAGRGVQYPNREMTIEGETFDLVDHGLSELDEPELGLLLQATYETLEMRVGVYLADRFDTAQLDEFEAFFKVGDNDGAFSWLQENAPDYKTVVAREAESLFAEIRASADEIQQLIRELKEDAS